MVAMILVAIGSSAAASGFMLLGIGLAMVPDQNTLVKSGYALLIGGLIVTLIGGLWYRSNEKKLEPASKH
jgi:membrane protein DedA with SNARE-associated domain